MSKQRKSKSRSPRPLGRKGITNEDLLQDMRIAAQGAPRGWLTVNSYQEFGRYSSDAVVEHFGSWNEALRLALPDVYAQRNPTDEEMLADLHRVADLCRAQMVNQDRNWYAQKVRSLSQAFYNQHGRYRWHYLLSHLGPRYHATTWRDLLITLGFKDLMRRQLQPPPAQLIADMHRVAELCREMRRVQPYAVRSLSQEFYHEHGQYPLSYAITKLRQHYGVHGWKEIKVEAGLPDV